MSVDIEEEKKSDVYSFSAILWEMLHRKTVWEDLSMGDIEMAVRNSQRPPITVPRDSDVINILVNIMTACWEQNPASRPSFSLLVSKLS